MKNFKRLPDAELAVMQALWRAGTPLTRPQLGDLLTEKQWTASTLVALLTRLEAKGYIAHEKQGRGYLYHALVPRQDYLATESKTLLGALYQGKPFNFIAALHDCGALDREDLEELRAQLDALSGEE